MGAYAASSGGCQGLMSNDQLVAAQLAAAQAIRLSQQLPPQGLPSQILPQGMTVPIQPMNVGSPDGSLSTPMQPHGFAYAHGLPLMAPAQEPPVFDAYGRAMAQGYQGQPAWATGHTTHTQVTAMAISAAAATATSALHAPPSAALTDEPAAMNEEEESLASSRGRRETAGLAGVWRGGIGLLSWLLRRSASRQRPRTRRRLRTSGFTT